MTYREKLVQFGDGRGLSGMLTIPTAKEVRAPGLILYNAGIVHRIGPHRLNVKVARAMAAKGVGSIRFDLSGLGDSRPAAGGNEARTDADIGAALDALGAASGASRFTLFGLCSGADNGYRAALADPRIAGLILVDPYAYANRRAKLERTAMKALDVNRWKAALARAAAPKGDTAPVRSEGDSSRPHPPRAEFGADLQKLTARGVRILIIYTRFVEEQLTRPEHFFETFADFDFGGRLEVEVKSGVDHTHTELCAQAALIVSVGGFIDALKE